MTVSQFSPLHDDCTAVLVLADGTVFAGFGVGHQGSVVGEVCFNTAMTGYQEILTDPSYMDQILVFTFPHIGNTGANSEDVEHLSLDSNKCARGAIFRDRPTPQASYRAESDFSDWMKARKLIGLWGIDTRALTRKIRQDGMPHGVIAYDENGQFDLAHLQKMAQNWAGLNGLDLASEASINEMKPYQTGLWAWSKGYENHGDGQHHVVVIDFGVKQNILRALKDQGARITLVPAQTSFDAILALKPDGVLLSNGPGDPAATGVFAVPTIKKIIEAGLPVFGICLGHQMLALALGAKTIKMSQGHHGANHPVKDLTTGKVEIVSMNHGFCVDQQSLPAHVQETHISLFDGTNCGIALKGKPVFSVQHHPEASPGPVDSLYLFDRFMANIKQSVPA